MNTPEESAPQEPAEPVSESPPEALPEGTTPSRKLRELFIAIFTWLVSVALLLLPQILALPYLLYYYQGKPLTRESLLADKTLVVLLVAGILPAHLITLAVTWAVATRFGKIPAKAALQWHWASPISILKSMGLAVVLFGLAWAVTLIFGGQETDIERILKSSRTAALIVAFLAVVTAPLVEEIVYRGILYPAWQRLTGSTAAVIIVTLSFALPHIPQYWPNMAVIASITTLSLILTIVRARTGNLLHCYLIHLVFNGVQAILIVLETLVRSLKTPNPDVVPTFIQSLLKIL
ncbi:MAG TPA: CPBP family intramembrane glutamic endopeptidase [Pyrinomonadaceae bacterium]|nr:CPBP family intramembrane glutamic endopeptidase [Pyrinomonadaceae bacterium]